MEVFDDEMFSQLDEMLGELDDQLRREKAEKACGGAETQVPHGAQAMGQAAAMRDANTAAISDANKVAIKEEASQLAVLQAQVKAQAQAEAQAQAQAQAEAQAQAQAQAQVQAQAQAQAKENALAQAGAEAKALALALTQAAALRALAQAQARSHVEVGKAAGEGAGADAALRFAASEAEQGAEALRRATAGMQRIRQAAASQVASVLIGQSMASQSAPRQHPAGCHPFPTLEPSTIPLWPSREWMVEGQRALSYQRVVYPQPAPAVTASPLPCLKPSAGGGYIVKAPERQPSLSSAVSSAPSSPISSPSAATTVASTNLAAAIRPTAILPATLATAFTSTALTAVTHSAIAASPQAASAMVPAAVGEVAQLAGDDAQCRFHQQRLEAQQKAKMQGRVALAIAQARREAESSGKRPREEEGGMTATAGPGNFHARAGCEEANLRAADLRLEHALRQAAPRPSTCLVRAWSAAVTAGHSLDSFKLDASPPGIRPVRRKLCHEQP